ncbi:hypothetical protein CMI45_03270 [Candidatus Pacearchaeota archaeon]|jgi:ribosomal protein L31E|nr:hypothetical protein [Candidatus Pacearchaeota archaeon]|tara:strand:+ start:441 stop:1046 length:606 start_codon:yes stop_codon:yes gene_type:complete
MAEENKPQETEEKPVKQTKEKQEAPKEKNERTYIIPLKKAYLKGRRYDRTRLAIREIRRFLVKHMKIRDRDLSKIKLDPYFNNEIWKRGKFSPPTKVKVKVIKTGDTVSVNFVDLPDSIKFAKAKNEKRHKAPEEKKAPEAPVEEKPEEKTEEEKKEEKEKQASVADAAEKQAEKTAKAEKHAIQPKSKPAASQRKVLSRH